MALGEVVGELVIGLLTEVFGEVATDAAAGAARRLPPRTVTRLKRGLFGLALASVVGGGLLGSRATTVAWSLLGWGVVLGGPCLAVLIACLLPPRSRVK